MNSLTRHYRRSQLTALPMPGGREAVPYCYVENVSGDREPVTHEFASWAVGDWRREVEAELCVNLTEGSKTTAECQSVLSAGSQKHSALSTCEMAIHTNASGRLSSSGKSSGR